ncbi:MAG TPA: HigA family addiction module antitoxin [Caulobacteraceae bacterium]|jgi:addiction module HigA family antidote
MLSNPLTAGLPAMHPGALLREDVLPALGRPKAEIARLLGISRQQLYDILDEKKPVTTSTALRLGKLCGNGPNLWINLQQAWDLEHASAELADELAKIPTLEAVA